MPQRLENTPIQSFLLTGQAKTHKEEYIKPQGGVNQQPRAQLGGYVIRYIT